MNIYPDWADTYILRTHVDNGRNSWALFSPCERYRYRLRREWGAGSTLCFLMLNPSTANEVRNDPTVERCERRARALGYDGFEVVNIFALRSTDPKALYKVKDPVGAENNRAIQEAIDATNTVLIAWGTHGKLNGRGDELRTMLKGKHVFHLGLTKSGEPRHPLYIAYSETPVEIVL